MHIVWERASNWLGAAAVVAAGVLSVGCGAYEPEPEYPRYVPPPPPPSAAELQQQQDPSAPGNGDIAIGGNADEYVETDPSALSEFKTTLDPVGTWVEDPTYGTVWVPSTTVVGSDFQPYVTAGHWTYADDTSWVWVSDYDWGWAPFHYGRWVHLPGHAWNWIPGRRYAGAWVVWRTGPGYDYVGWAPAPPDYYWYHGVAFYWGFGWYHHHDHYVYCHNDHVYHHNTYVVRGAGARVHDGRTADYAPANPGVGGGGDRVIAQPGVNGRVQANPSVNGSLATAARGPKPKDIGIRPDTVVAPPQNHQGTSRAVAFASPRTATQHGAAPPVGARVATPSNPSFTGGNRPSPSVSARLDPVARAPQMRGVAPRSSSLPDYRPTPSYRPSSPGVAAGSPPSSSWGSTPSRSSPSSSPSWGSSSPSYRPSSPSVSSPSYRSSPSSPSVSSPSYRSSPSFGSSSPSYRSSPSVSSPSRSTPSSSFRSSPSISSPSRSSPSVSRPSSGGGSSFRGSSRRR